jgi:hypothetical protein
VGGPYAGISQSQATQQTAHEHVFPCLNITAIKDCPSGLSNEQAVKVNASVNTVADRSQIPQHDQSSIPVAAVTSGK